MLEKALAQEALDVALLDLEDGVPASEKESARRLVADALGRPRGRVQRYVRVSRPGSRELRADLEAALRPGLDGLVIPKVSTAEELRLTERVVRERAGRDVALLPSIETAAGLLEAPAIAALGPFVVGLLFGAEDFARDLGLPTRREREARELLYARSALVVAAKAAGRLALDGIWPDIADLAGLRGDALQARRLGFDGKSLIHPDQIAVVNEVFQPTAEEIAWARTVVGASEEAEREGRAAVAVDGELIDPPIVARARRVLQMGRPD